LIPTNSWPDDQEPTPPRWSLNLEEAEKPKVELLKVDTARFVFLWESSSSVEEFVERSEDFQQISIASEVAKVIRTVEAGIPLRELPDRRPAVKRSSRLQNFS